MARKVLQSLDNIIGEDNKFIMGDKPCDEDAAIFGFVTWVLCNTTEDNYHNEEIKKLANVMRYFETMKENYWKDWEDKRYKGKSIVGNAWEEKS